MSDLFRIEPAVLKVALLGHPVLRQNVEPVTKDELKDPRTAYFIDSMIETMREYNGAGLAAPQVHVSKRILVIEEQTDPRNEKEHIPLTVLVNPEITSFSKEMEEGWEGCLSVKDVWGRVKRSTAVTVKALARDGNERVIEAEGFFAVVLQHEIDHLYGKLFLDRMENLSTLCFTQEYRRYWSD